MMQTNTPFDEIGKMHYEDADRLPLFKRLKMAVRLLFKKSNLYTGMYKHNYVPLIRSISFPIDQIECPDMYAFLNDPNESSGGSR